MFFPATACLIQDRLGAKNAWGFDLSAACSGFAYALTVGAQFVGSGAHKKVLVIGSDVMTSILDFRIAPPASSSATAPARSFSSPRSPNPKASWISATTWTAAAAAASTCPAAAR